MDVLLMQMKCWIFFRNVVMETNICSKHSSAATVTSPALWHRHRVLDRCLKVGVRANASSLSGLRGPLAGSTMSRFSFSRAQILPLKHWSTSSFLTASLQKMRSVTTWGKPAHVLAGRSHVHCHSGEMHLCTPPRTVLISHLSLCVCLTPLTEYWLPCAGVSSEMPEKYKLSILYNGSLLNGSINIQLSYWPQLPQSVQQPHW